MALDVPPPAAEESSPEHPIHDPRYRLLPPDLLPATECLKDVVARVLPYWYDTVAPQLLAGMTVLITAHGNSLRAMLKHLEHVSDEEIAAVNIPTGVPRRYRFDDRLEVADVEGERPEVPVPTHDVERMVRIEVVRDLAARLDAHLEATVSSVSVAVGALVVRDELLGAAQVALAVR